MGGHLESVCFFYLGIFSQHLSISIVNDGQLIQHLVLMLLLHIVLGIDSAAQVSG